MLDYNRFASNFSQMFYFLPEVADSRKENISFILLCMSQDESVSYEIDICRLYRCHIGIY